MKSFFIEKTLNDVFNKYYKKLNELIFITPNHNSKYILEKSFMNLCSENTYFFCTKIYTIEEFIQEISGLLLIEWKDLLFKFYHIIYKNYKNNEVKINHFIKYSEKILSDFDELDINIVNMKQFFNYMSSIKDINDWEIKDFVKKNFFIKKNNDYWNNISNIYFDLKKNLLCKGLAYNGLLFRNAFKNINNFIKINHKIHKIIFIGINFPSKSELGIIKYLNEVGILKIYLDIINYDDIEIEKNFNCLYRDFLYDEKIKKNVKCIYQNTNNNFKKKIEIINSYGKIGQVKIIGDIINNYINNKKNINNIGIIPCDKNLVIPILNSIPLYVNKLNINVIFKSHYIHINEIFLIIFKLFITYDKKKLEIKYIKDLINALHLYKIICKNNIEEFLKILSEENLIYINHNTIKKFLKDDFLLKILDISDYKSINIIKKFSYIINILKKSPNNNIKNYIKNIEYWIVNIQIIIDKYESNININRLLMMYNQLLNSKNLRLYNRNSNVINMFNPFEGNLFNFRTIIIVSLNEGIYPSYNKIKFSWIPFNIRKHFKLLDYKKIDKLYTYNFYQLLGKSKNIFLIYNSSINENLTYDKSRFIHQIEHTLKNKILNRKLIYNFFKRNKKIKYITIEKTPLIIQKIKQICYKGLSPSNIILYVKNPLIFYIKNILNLKNFNINNNKNIRLGLMTHKIIDNLYNPYKGNKITKNIIKELKNSLDINISKFFKKMNIKTKGNNVFIYHTIKNYLKRLISWDEKFVNNGCNIIIKNIESNLFVELYNFPCKIHLTGIIDRIDTCDGKLRIIDYKTGIVNNKNFKLNVDELIYNKINLIDLYDDKAIQLIIYSIILFLYNKKSIKFIYPSIFSFKMKKTQLTPLIINNNEYINENIINIFIKNIFSKIEELINPKIPFIIKKEFLDF